MGTDTQQAASSKDLSKRPKDRKSRVLHFVPRLMDMETAAAYVCLSYWTIRGLVQTGKLQTVEVPRAGDESEPIRRVLIDREDLDTFVDGLRRSRRPD